MERFYLFFLVLFLLGNARGIGVWDGQPAQQWRRGGLKSLEDPPSPLVPAQQTSSSSLPSAGQSLEVGATHAESISNSNARLLSWKPNVHGGSSISELNPQAQGAASDPVSAQSLGSGAELQSQYTAGDQEIHRQHPPPSKAQSVLSVQSSTPPKCAYRRRPSAFNIVPEDLKPQSPTYVPGYQSGQFSKPLPQSQRDSMNQQDSFGVQDSPERLSSQTSPQNLQTKYVSTFQAQASRPVATFQSLASASKPPQQGSYGVPSHWYALQGQSIPLASHSSPPKQTLGLSPQSQSLASASDSSQQGSNGVASSSLYTSHGQSISSNTRPTLVPRPVASSHILASASKPPQQRNYGVQSSWYASLEQSNPPASQLNQYAPVFQSQSSGPIPPASGGLANQYSSMSQSLLDQTGANVGPSSLYTPLQGQDVQASWFDALNQDPVVQTQSLYKPVFQSQGLEKQDNLPSEYLVRAHPSGCVQWYKVSQTGLEAVRTIEPLPPLQSLVNLYNQVTSSNHPPLSQSPNSPIAFGFASQNWSPTSTLALTPSSLNRSPLHPTMLQVPQSPWP